MTNKDKPRELESAREQLDHVAWILDDMFRIPGLNWRFGIDSVIGLIPGAGDIITAVLGLTLLVRAFQFRLPRVVMARMVLNSLIDILVGAIPFVGDLFDFVWKSNSMNMKLFHQYAQEPDRSTQRHWVFMGLLLFVLLGSIVLITVGMFFVLRSLVSWP